MRTKLVLKIINSNNNYGENLKKSKKLMFYLKNFNSAIFKIVF